MKFFDRFFLGLNAILFALVTFAVTTLIGAAALAIGGVDGQDCTLWLSLLAGLLLELAMAAAVGLIYGLGCFLDR